MNPALFGLTAAAAPLAWQRFETNLFVYFGMYAFTDRACCRFPGDSGIDAGVDALAKIDLGHWLETGEPPERPAPRVNPLASVAFSDFAVYAEVEPS